MAVSYAFERWRRPRLKDSRANVSLILSAAGRYYFALDEWKYADCVYLDKAPAVISGVICVQGRRQLYLLDIKLWRTFVLAVPDTAALPTDHAFHDRARHALPLFTS